jgi:hypothetical protein
MIIIVTCLIFIFFRLGRELRSDSEYAIDDLLPCDRTVRNEVERAARHERDLLKIKLIAAAEDYRLSISPDIWSDGHRKISYLGATAHFVDENGIFHSIDLFCSEFKWKKKTAVHVLMVRFYFTILKIITLCSYRCWRISWLSSV